MRLSALYRYPLKSARGETLQQIGLDKLGLQGDRRWMLVDEASGRFLTQRAVARMSQLSALWNDQGGLTLSAPGHSTLEVALPGADAPLRGVTIWQDTLRVPDAGDEAAAWVSEFIGKPSRLVQVPAQRARSTAAGYGRDDDQVAFADGFPLLLIGQASLDDLVARVGRPLEMLRFRPNLVVEGSAALPRTTGSACVSAMSSSVWSSHARAAFSPPSIRRPASAVPTANLWPPCRSTGPRPMGRCSARTWSMMATVACR